MSKAHRLLYHSTLGSRVIKKRRGDGVVVLLRVQPHRVPVWVRDLKRAAVPRRARI